MRMVGGGAGRARDMHGCWAQERGRHTGTRATAQQTRLRRCRGADAQPAHVLHANWAPRFALQTLSWLQHRQLKKSKGLLGTLNWQAKSVSDLNRSSLLGCARANQLQLWLWVSLCCTPTWCYISA